MTVSKIYKFTLTIFGIKIVSKEVKYTRTKLPIGQLTQFDSGVIETSTRSDLYSTWLNFGSRSLSLIGTE